MSEERIKWISVANAIFWALLLVQIPLLWSIPLPESGPDHVREFAQHYRVTASLELCAFVVASLALSVAMWVRPRRWVALGLGCIAVIFLYRMHLAGVSVLFRPPAGDGSLVGAMRGWWQFNGNWWLIRLPLLLTCIVAWFVIYAGLSKQRARSQV
jgi:hypothetical protein